MNILSLTNLRLERELDTSFGSTKQGALMTIEEVAECLRLHPSTVCRLVRCGVIPAVKVGKQWGVDSQTLEDWLRENATRPEEAISEDGTSSSAGPTLKSSGELP